MTKGGDTNTFEDKNKGQKRDNKGSRKKRDISKSDDSNTDHVAFRSNPVGFDNSSSSDKDKDDRKTMDDEAKKWKQRKQKSTTKKIADENHMKSRSQKLNI